MGAVAKKLSSVKMLALAKIRRDGGTQIRIALNEEAVMDLVDAYRAERTVPPVVVFFDGDAHWLADGFHRCEGASRLGLPKIAADVRLGTQREAVLFAVGANAMHWGVRRSAEDKRNAVSVVLRDSEWRKWSDRKVAECCGVSPPFVATVRGELSVIGFQSPTVRQGADGRVIDTAGIGRRHDPGFDNERAPIVEAVPPAPREELPPEASAALHETMALARLAGLCQEFEREFVFIFERQRLASWTTHHTAALSEIARVTGAIERETARL